MTVQELKQYKFLQGEIEELEAEISELRSVKTIDVVKASYSDFPYTEHSLKVYGSDENTQSLIAQKQQKKAELEQQRIKIEQFISNIQDCQIRQILKCRYIKGYSWAEVAKAVKGNNTRDSVRIMSIRFLKKYNKK